MNSDDDEAGPKSVELSREQERDLEIFAEEAQMIGKLRRVLLRGKLKREKLKLLAEVASINKKLKILDKLEEEAKERRKGLSKE